MIRPDRQGLFDYPFTKVVTGDTSYYAAHVFDYHGSDIVGIPLAIKIIAGWVDNTTQSLRIYDITNNQVICERTDITSEFPSSEDMGAINNVPTDPALWEVQLKRPSGPTREVAVASLQMEF